MQTDHIYLKFDLTNFTTTKIQIPPRIFPKDFSVEKDDFFCGGYFVGYDCSYSAKELSEICKKRKFSILANISADFLIVFIDKLTKEIFALTSQSGRFPLYFCFENHILSMTTDFGFLSRNSNKHSIDLEFLLDDIYDNHSSFLTESTLFNEIKQVPPATLLTVKQDEGFLLTPLIDLNDFLPKEERYSTAEFADEVVKLLNKIIMERLFAIGHLPFLIELSSGYDSSLVAALLAKKTKLAALSYVFKLASGVNNQHITKKFGEKHNIAITFLDTSNLFLFSTKAGEEFIQRYYYPLDHGMDLALKRYRTIYEMGYRIIFEGYGGDELYMGKNSNTAFRFPIQMGYFQLVRGLQDGLDKIFTEKGLHFLLSKDRFVNRSLYAHGIATSSVSVGLQYFPVYWKTGIWGLSPLSDPRMTKLFCYCPKNVEKRELWKERDDIFLKEQLLQKKTHSGKHVDQFITNPATKAKIIDILKNSYLNYMGIIKGNEIINNLRSGKQTLYTNETSPFLLNIIMIEHFLQGVLK